MTGVAGNKVWNPLGLALSRHSMYKRLTKMYDKLTDDKCRYSLHKARSIQTDMADLPTKKATVLVRSDNPCRGAAGISDPTRTVECEWTQVMSANLSEQQWKLTTPLLVIFCVWIFWSICTSCCNKTLSTGDKKDRLSDRYNGNSKRKRSHRPSDEQAASIAVNVMNIQLEIRLLIHSLVVEETWDGYPKSIPDFSPIQKVSWFQEVFRPLQTDPKDFHAIWSAANVAEGLRPWFTRKPVTLQDVIDWNVMVLPGLGDKLPQFEDVSDLPFRSKANLELIRCLAETGFQFKVKKKHRAKTCRVRKLCHEISTEEYLHDG